MSFKLPTALTALRKAIFNRLLPLGNLLLNIFPPLILLFGDSLNQLASCFAVINLLNPSGPISLIIVKMVECPTNWEDRDNNSNIEEAALRTFLKQKYSDELVAKAIFALKKEATINNNDDLYTANKEVYNMLRYGTSKKVEAINKPEHVDFIDWKNPQNNHFAIAEEVTLKGTKERRPDVVLYINGIAIGVLELKRASISASQGIRQNISNQSPYFNASFFTTIQLVLAGNDSNGLYYGTTKTEEKYFLKWKEENDTYNANEILLDKHIAQFCNKERLIEMMHDFVVFDFGTKKLCRPNQYFGVKAAQKCIAPHHCKAFATALCVPNNASLLCSCCPKMVGCNTFLCCFNTNILIWSA